MTQSLLITFLIDVGRWAMSALQERWLIRLQGKEADLSKMSQLDKNMIQSLPSSQEIESLIKRRHSLIMDKENAKLADLEQLNRGDISQSMYELREREHNRIIEKLLNEIANQLDARGIELEREAI